MAVSADVVKALRDQTGISVMECKKALEQADGNVEKALEILKARSTAMVEKKQDRNLAAGTVAAYVHGNAQVGALVLLSCETDFVSKNEEFTKLAYDIAMHAAAMRPANVEELLAQPFIKESDKTIGSLISAATQKFGERIEVSRAEVFSVK